VSEIVLHFTAGPGTDLSGLQAALERRTAALQGVQKARAEVEDNRDPVTTVLLTLTLGAELFSHGADMLDALKRFIDSAKGVAESLGLRDARLEVGMQQVPPEALTAAHAAEITGAKSAPTTRP
jgi:hypothetical protein